MVADYVIIEGGVFRMVYSGTGEMDKSLEFTLPSGARVDSNSILIFTSYTSVAAGATLNCRININTKEVYNRPISEGNFYGSHHAIIGANILKEADKTNNIEFEIQGSGNSTLRVSDMYLMIQR
jgi:hypothetical protein